MNCGGRWFCGGGGKQQDTQRSSEETRLESRAAAGLGMDADTEASLELTKPVWPEATRCLETPGSLPGH